ncbi:MAG: response regulator transcription factor [Verrucomicrobiota bacterium]
MVQNKMVRVMVVQGYCLLREALIERLEKETWIEVCAAASGLDEARMPIKQHQPDVLVLNVSLKCSAGISSLRKLKCDFPGLAVIAFSCDSEFENAYVGQVLRAGADGYVSSENSLDDLIHAIQSVREGNTAKLQWSAHLAQESMLTGLSRQETEVFCLTGCGFVPKRIAEKMKLSVKTVESYRERIRAKMDLPSGADLLYISTSFMRSAARRRDGGSDGQMVKELLSTTR